MLKIKGTQLQEVMNFLKPSFGTKTQNAYAKSILFTLSKEENTIDFRVNDGLIETSLTLLGGDFEIKESTQFCVDEFIQNVILRLKGELEFVIIDGEDGVESLEVRTGKKVYQYGLLDPEKFPKPIELNSLQVKFVLLDDHEAFFKNFVYSSFCASEHAIANAYKSFDLRDGMLSTTNKNIGIVIKADIANANPPAKELLAVLEAFKKLEADDEVFYSFNRDLIVIKTSRKTMDVQYVFVPIDDKLPDKFFSMIENYTNETPQLQFTIDQESLQDAIEQAVIYANKASQEGYPTYTTLQYDGKNIRFLMDIPKVSNFNFDVEVTDLTHKVEEYNIHIDPVDFTKYISTVGGDVTMKFFDPTTLFICESTVHPDMIYFQTTVRLREEA